MDAHTVWPEKVDGHKKFNRRVEFEEIRDRDTRGGKHKQLAIMTHRACDCDDADIDTSYRMCCISVNNGPPFKASTLFDTGAHASFVNTLGFQTAKNNSVNC